MLEVDCFETEAGRVGMPDSASAQELLAKQVRTYDESELGKLRLEISQLDSACGDHRKPRRRSYGRSQTLPR